MERYLVISNHSLEECNAAIKYFRDYHAGYLTHFEWGCFDNDHNAYAIIEAESHESAVMSVPPFFRNKAKAVKLTTFDPARDAEKLAHVGA